jgi:HEAT repeat protein
MTKNVSSKLQLCENLPLWRRRRATRIWALAGGTLVGLAVLAWVAPWCYRFIKTKTAQEVTFESFPSSQQVTLSPGNACIVRLPNRRTVALWCSRARGIAAALDESDLTFEYGEAPFTSLKREEVPLPGGGVTSGEYLSYIRQGPVITSGNTREYVLYVDKYCLNISSEAEGQRGDSLPLMIYARMATEKELIPRKQEREHYLHALHSNDPKTRREAIHELGLMVAMGSTYAGNALEIAEAIRPFLKDSEEAVRNEALVRLQVMGDDDALLEMLTPKPIPEFIERNGAWTIAGWCRKDSERVPKHVMTYFETDDPKLHEFALAFFSCYDTSDAAAQPFVVKYLKSDVPEVRAAAASAIRLACDGKTAVSLLHEALGDRSDKVLLEALKGVSYFNDSIPVQRIITLLTSHNPEVRAQAAYALESCRNPAAVEPLLLATRDAESSVRAQAAVSLGRIGDVKSYGRLLELLKDESADVRESAVNGLRWMGQRDAIKAITALADEDPNENVRQMAKRTVRELGEK